ncbi:hypothetical protein [Lysobacter arvi]|uniref:Autotransporter outer membrane beta-barrel domain-containing protein n=1 Tax=Lysobacter arvi TaxID=3038776 RepID=A0ABU1CH09_9GAMM|nr:hypothetical protein [Lysobacter arvi]MDR0184217.1 hypothetical protein [Lysobacter arvi]
MNRVIAAKSQASSFRQASHESRISQQQRAPGVFHLGAQYRFTDTWGVVAEWDESEEMRRYRVGLRASF